MNRFLKKCWKLKTHQIIKTSVLELEKHFSTKPEESFSFIDSVISELKLYGFTYWREGEAIYIGKNFSEN